MRAVVQRVKKASVTVSDNIVSETQKGILVFLGVGKEDDISDLDYLCTKIINLRIFEDDNDKLNLSLLDIKGEILVVSQFTLYGDCRKGRRPNFMNAARPEAAENMYNKFIEKCKSYGINVSAGKFQQHMDVELVNDGPVTILIDSKKNF